MLNSLHLLSSSFRSKSRLLLLFIVLGFSSIAIGQGGGSSATSFSYTPLNLTANSMIMSPMAPYVSPMGATLTGFMSTPALPTGLTFSGSGAITGTPSSAQSQTSYVVSAMNASSQTLTTTVEITINASGGSSSNTTTYSYNNSNGYLGSSFNSIPSISSVFANSFVLTSGTLPTGLTLNTSNGTISGVPTAVNSSTVTITAYNSNTLYGTATINFNIIQRTYYSIANGPWNMASTWSLTSGGSAVSSGFPTAGDNVIIEGGYTVTIAGNETVNAANLTIGSSTNGTLRYVAGGTSTLTLSGDLTIGGSTGSGSLNYDNWGLTITCSKMLKGTGTANRTNSLNQDFTFTGSFTLPSSFNQFRNFIINGGTVTLSANVETNGSTSPYIYAGSTLDLKTYDLTIGGWNNFEIHGSLIIGGANNFPTGFTNLVINPSSTVTYNFNGNQNIFPTTYGNLIIDGSGIKSPSGRVSALTIVSGGSNYNYCGGLTLDFNGGGGTGASGTASADFMSGSLNSTTITNGGSGYTSAPTVTIGGYCSGNGANITATITKNITATNITIKDGSTLSALTGNVTASGTIIVNPGGALIGSSVNVTGTVRLQQNIVGQRGWRLLANPFSTSQTSLASTGLNAASSGSNDVKIWSNASNSWSSAGAGFNSLTIPANTAYAAFIRGSSLDNISGATYTSGPSAFIYNVSGTLNSATTSITPSNASNFMVVGNPYAAPVKTQALTGGVSLPYYTYKISVTGSPTVKSGSWVASSSNSSATATIPVMGVLCYMPTSSSLFTITTSDINTTGTPETGLFSSDVPIQQMEVVLNKGQDFVDKLFIRSDFNATINGNDRLDLPKYQNETTNFYTVSPDKTQLAVDTRKEWSQNVPLGLKTPAGNYSISIQNNTLSVGKSIYLKDNYLNSTTLLKVGTVYDFSVSMDSLSQGDKRFELQFGLASNTLPTDESLNGGLRLKVIGTVLQGNLLTIEVGGIKANEVGVLSLIDMNGRIVKNTSVVNGVNKISVNELTNGLQLIKLSNGKNQLVKKFIKD